MARKKTVQEVTPQSLDEIRNSIRTIDEKRRDQSLTPQERELLELSAVTLRKAERTAAEALQKHITAEFSDAVKDLKKQSSLIRSRITRMSKVPKALDQVESVIGGLVSVMKEISRWSFCLIFVVLMTASCSVLTKSQIKMAAALSTAADTVTASPALIFENLTQVRKERGMLYSASLSSPQAHWDEVTSLSKHLMDNAVQTKKAEVYVKALNSYSRAVGSLANKARWTRYGTELKGIGRNVDSLLTYMDDTGWVDDEITTGFAKLGGRYAAILTENYMKCRQARIIRECVIDADTLVNQCVESVVAILKSDDMKLLIDNEKSALKDDYRAFLDAASLTTDRMMLSMKGDAIYMECDVLLDKTSRIRTKCITALHTFARTHSKLASNFQKRSSKSSGELAEDIYDDIAELNLISVQLTKLLKD